MIIITHCHGEKILEIWDSCIDLFTVTNFHAPAQLDVQLIMKKHPSAVNPITFIFYHLLIVVEIESGMVHGGGKVCPVWQTDTMWKPGHGQVSITCGFFSEQPVLQLQTIPEGLQPNFQNFSFDLIKADDFPT